MNLNENSIRARHQLQSLTPAKTKRASKNLIRINYDNSVTAGKRLPSTKESMTGGSNRSELNRKTRMNTAALSQRRHGRSAALRP